MRYLLIQLVPKSANLILLTSGLISYNAKRHKETIPRTPQVGGEGQCMCRWLVGLFS